MYRNSQYHHHEIEHLARSLHPIADWKAQYMAFVTAYMDECKSDPFFVFAGLVSTTAGWTRFSREWGKVLAEYQIPYLHMKEYAFYKGPFQGWMEPKRKSLLGRLLFLIRSSRDPIYTFSCSFNYREFDELFPKKFQAKQGHYSFAVQNCLCGIKVHCDRLNILTEGQQVDFVFDQQEEFAFRAHSAFTNFKSNPKFQQEQEILGSLSFADDRQVQPLQAADLLAYEISKKLRGFDRFAGNALNELSGSHAVWPRSNLAEYASEMKLQVPELFEE